MSIKPFIFFYHFQFQRPSIIMIIELGYHFCAIQCATKTNLHFISQNDTYINDVDKTVKYKIFSVFGPHITYKRENYSNQIARSHNDNYYWSDIKWTKQLLGSSGGQMKQQIWSNTAFLVAYLSAGASIVPDRRVTIDNQWLVLLQYKIFPLKLNWFIQLPW